MLHALTSCDSKMGGRRTETRNSGYLFSSNCGIERMLSNLYANLLLNRIDELASLHQLLPRQGSFTLLGFPAHTSRSNVCCPTSSRTSNDVDVQVFWVLFGKHLLPSVRIRKRPLLEDSPLRISWITSGSKSRSTATQQDRKLPLSDTVIPAGSDIFIQHVWDIGEVANTPLGDAHVFQDWSEFCLVHFVEVDVWSAMSSVLPGEVDDWAGEPDVAVDLRGAVILCCCNLIGANEGLKVREGVECKDPL